MTQQTPQQLLYLAQSAQQAEQPEKALGYFQQLLRFDSTHLEIQIQCGNLCVALHRFEEAADYFRRVFEQLHHSRDVRAANAAEALCYALNAQGNAAYAQGKYSQAAPCFEEATQHLPQKAEYWYNLGNTLRELGQTEKAFFAFQKSLSIQPHDADAWNNLGNIARELGRLDEAILHYQQAIKIDPSLHHALVHLVHQKQHICDWQALASQIDSIRHWVKTLPEAKISPFAFLAMPGTTPAEQLQCASHWANQHFRHTPLPKRKSLAKQKIHVGYLSADFRLHPLAFLITEMLQAHDKTRFKTFAYSYGNDDQSAERKRIMQSVDDFVDIRDMNDLEAAQRIQRDDIDILVDLTGYTQSSRTGIVAYRPATIHVNWLGFPSSMGQLPEQSLFDFLIADDIIIPDGCETHYSERIIRLPCYQPNNQHRPTNHSQTRADNGLPAKGVVFCCFNQTFKITPDIFARWMQILNAVPDSVLWLLECNVWAKQNLIKAATQAGINSSRLIFAPRVNIQTHLVRHKHADLFLDTLPYNAHTTASDALWMGLPVLTCAGETFASRVAASLLNGLKMPNLITDNLNRYQEIAIRLGNHPSELVDIKLQLKLRLANSNIFNPTLFCRQLETQYTEMLSLKPRET